MCPLSSALVHQEHWTCPRGPWSGTPVWLHCRARALRAAVVGRPPCPAREGGRFLAFARSTIQERDLFKVPRVAAQIAKLNMRVLETKLRAGAGKARGAKKKRPAKAGVKKKLERKQKRREAS